MRLEEIMTAPVLTITAELSVAEAAQRMRAHDVGSLVVVRKGVVEGIHHKLGRRGRLRGRRRRSEYVSDHAVYEQPGSIQPGQIPTWSKPPA